MNRFLPIVSNKNIILQKYNTFITTKEVARLQPKIRKMKFKETHKTALAKVLSDLIQSDGIVNQGEMDCLTHVFKVLNITASSTKKSADLSLSNALFYLKSLGNVEKMAILKILQQLSLSDDSLDPNESLLISAMLLSIQIDLPETQDIHANLVSIPNLAFDTQNAVLYVESAYDTNVNAKIEQEYDAICNLLKDSNRDFFYLPKVMQEMSRKSNTFHDTLSYLEPTLTDEQLDLINTNIRLMTTADLSKEIFLNYLNINGFLLEKPCFFFKISNKMPSRFQNFLILEIDSDPLQTLQQFYKLNSSITKLKINGLTDKEKRSINKLSLKAKHEEKDEVQYTGFHKVIIDTLLKYNGSQGISRIFVAENGSIYLTDRNNIEVKMSSISKALYILFLLHAEGIKLNYLVDHKQQLYKIYRQISTYAEDELLQTAVENIIDITGTTMSANISRIKKAFVSVLGDDATLYLIQGNRNEKKTINLDRKLVVFENRSLFE